MSKLPNTEFRPDTKVLSKAGHTPIAVSSYRDEETQDPKYQKPSKKCQSLFTDRKHERSVELSSTDTEENKDLTSVRKSSRTSKPKPTLEEEVNEDAKRFLLRIMQHLMFKTINKKITTTKSFDEEGYFGGLHYYNFVPDVEGSSLRYCILLSTLLLCYSACFLMLCFYQLGDSLGDSITLHVAFLGLNLYLIYGFIEAISVLKTKNSCNLEFGSFISDFLFYWFLYMNFCHQRWVSFDWVVSIFSIFFDIMGIIFRSSSNKNGFSYTSVTLKYVLWKIYELYSEPIMPEEKYSSWYYLIGCCFIRELLILSVGLYIWLKKSKKTTIFGFTIMKRILANPKGSLLRIAFFMSNLLLFLLFPFFIEDFIHKLEYRVLLMLLFLQPIIITLIEVYRIYHNRLTFFKKISSEAWEGPFIKPRPKEELFRITKRFYHIKRISDNYFSNDYKPTETEQICLAKDDLCAICMERKNNIIIEPCHHTGLCIICAIGLQLRNSGKLKCPYCQDIAKTFKKFIRHDDKYIVYLKQYT